jgi:hypothetical protein
MTPPMVATLPGTRLLPPTLERLLLGLRVVRRHQVVLRNGGASVACGAGAHEFRLWLEGLFQPSVQVGAEQSARLSLSLQLLTCVNCETVEVRDVGVDRLDSLPMGSLAPRRRSALLGWYTGSRRNHRTYL